MVLSSGFSAGFFCASSWSNYVIKGCLSVTWTVILDREGIWCRLVLGAAGRKSPCQSPLNRDNRGKVKANMHPCSHSAPLESLTLTFWQTPLGLRWLWNPECSNASFFLFSFFFPERGSDQECLLERQTQIETSHTSNNRGERERDRGWNGVVPPYLPTELCLKFVVLLRKVAVKLDSSPWTLSYLKCNDIKESCLTIVCRHVT